jgi:hypothetical protein
MLAIEMNKTKHKIAVLRKASLSGHYEALNSARNECHQEWLSPYFIPTLDSFEL